MNFGNESGRILVRATRSLWANLPLWITLAACNVPNPPGSSGATDGGSCPASLVVVESDFASTNVALVAMDGRVLTGSLASSATAGLGGDVVPPNSASTASVVLLDRYPNERIVWVDPHNATVTSELSVATGFASNPHDYVDVAPGKAYVTRYDQNLAAGAQPFDVGSDVLVVDPGKHAIVSSIDLRPAVADVPGVEPRPDRIAIFDNRAFVLLDALTADWKLVTSSRIAEIDVATDTVVSVLTLPGLKDCTGLLKSPFRTELAVLCSALQASTGTTELDASGIAVVDVTGSPTVTRTFPATIFGTNPIGFYGAYASADAIVFQSFGHLADGSTPAADDIAYRFDVATGKYDEILRSAGEPFTIGGIACEPSCGACFIADAGRGGVLHRYDVDASGVLSNERVITVERTIGLPPRDLGMLR